MSTTRPSAPTSFRSGRPEDAGREVTLDCLPTLPSARSSSFGGAGSSGRANCGRSSRAASATATASPWSQSGRAHERRGKPAIGSVRRPVPASGSGNGGQMYHFRLQRTDGSPADPPTYRSSVLNWRQGDRLTLLRFEEAARRSKRPGVRLSGLAARQSRRGAGPRPPAARRRSPSMRSPRRSPRLGTRR
jgi:hypothetical protein